jgi:2-amino-4-hydroxy-6-hydroxymethyldihydropteridine diphosphokinase
MRTAVGLGSNLGDRLHNLRAARKAILGLSTVKPPILSSPIYETDPVDCERGAEKFLNAVVEFDYEGDPANLLEQLIRIEEGLGRRRDHAKNVSRTIDIDLLYCGDRNIENERLQLPHPRMHLRKFVLQPLADIRADLVLSGQKKSVTNLLEDFGESGEVVRVAESW